ncbi:MAG: hypothetical protein HYZ90_03640 [Candidatus Omnitrophica bacterium]|nr:hypothetical protein [Candidatus Omnitrophota bacterium]
MIGILNKHRVPYAVVGAFAASFYGVVRASVDADAVISLQSAGVSAATLMEELRKAGFKSVHRRGEQGDPIGAVMIVEDGFGNRVDLLMNVRGMAEGTFSRAVEAEFMDKPVRFIGVEDLIAMKIFAGGPQDLSAVGAHRL